MSTMSQGGSPNLNNQDQLEYQDLEALFNYQGENFTENDESEVPFYVPSCMDEQRGNNRNYHGSELLG